MFRKMNLAVLASAMLMLAACAKPVSVVTALPEAKRGAIEVVDVDVRLAEGLEERMVKFDDKAARQREQQNLPAWEDSMSKPDEGRLRDAAVHRDVSLSGRGCADQERHYRP